MEHPLEAAAAVADFFWMHEYSEETLNRLGSSELRWDALATLSKSGWPMDVGSELDLLVRPFYLGETLPFAGVTKLVPPKS